MSSHALYGYSTDRNHRHDATGRTSVLVAMYVGLGLTVIATVVPFIDRTMSHVLADHIRAAYPDYTQTRIDTAVTTYVVYLSVVGALGVVSWLWSIHAVTKGKRWAPVGATAIFVLGLAIAVTNLLIKDTSGDTGLPPFLGLVGILPCIPGLLAVTLLWRKP